MTRRLYRVRTKSAGTTAWRITDTAPTDEARINLVFEEINVGPDFWWGVRNWPGLSLFCGALVIAWFIP